MKTIEERAKVSIPDAVNPDEILPAREAFIVGQQRIAYILGAREQKAIDEEAQINHNDESNYKQGYHDAVEKACEYLDIYFMEIGYPDDWFRDSPNIEGGRERFIKAMEG